MTQSIEATYLLILNDSQLIVNQIIEKFQAKDSQMSKYVDKTGANAAHFKDFVSKQILRSKNSNADTLARLTST